MTPVPSRSVLKRRKCAALAAVAALVLAALAACSGSPAAKANDDLVLGRAMDVTTLDPGRNLCDTCQIYNSAVYETVVKAPNATDALEPLLATKWEANADNTVFTFTLNPDATFADGSPVEAKDVKWSWDRIKNLKGSPAYFMAGIKSVEAPDAHTVVVTSEAPNSSFFNVTSASYMGIINSDVASKHGATADENAAKTDKAENWFLKNSAGSGQYVLKTYAEGSQLVMDRNDKYWGDKAAFSKVTIKEVTDPSAQLQQLQQGDIDVAMNLSFDSVDKVKADKNLSVKVDPSFNFVYVALSPGAPGAEALKDPKVRQAIRDGIDYDSVIDATVAGNGVKQSTGLANGFVGAKDLPLPEFRPDEAKKLLAEAGYAKGLKLTATFPTFSIYGVNSSTMFQSIQQSLKSVGVDLKLNPIEFSQWVDQIDTKGFPVTSVYFAPDHPDPVQYVQYFALAKDTVWSARARMDARPVETQLIAKALSSSGDEREQAYADLGGEMYKDAIILPIVNPKILLASSSDVEGNNYHVTRNLDLSVMKFKN